MDNNNQTPKIDTERIVNQKAWDEIMGTPQKREKIAAEMQALQVQPGWITISKILQIHITEIEANILDNDTLTQDQQNELKKDRARYKLFKTLPATLVQDAMNPQSQQEVNDDVYE